MELAGYVALVDTLTLGGLLETYRSRLGINLDVLATRLGGTWSGPAVSALTNNRFGTNATPGRLRELATAFHCSEREYTELLRAASFYPADDELADLCHSLQTELDQYPYPALLEDDRGYVYACNPTWSDRFGPMDSPTPSTPPHLLTLLLDPQAKLHRQVLAASADSWRRWVQHELAHFWQVTDRLLALRYANESPMRERIAWRQELLDSWDALPTPGGSEFRRVWKLLAEARPQLTVGAMIGAERFQVRDAATRHPDQIITYELVRQPLPDDARFNITLWLPLRVSRQEPLEQPTMTDLPVQANRIIG